MKKFFLNINITKQIRFMLAVLLLCFSTQALASHFRFGLVTATRLSETSTTVTYRINVSTSWRLGTAPPSTPFSFSGGNSGSVSVPMTNVTDPSGGWTNSTGTATITLNKSATLTRLTSTSCCKISTLINNRDRNWDIYIVLNTNDPGSSPVSTSAAIINMPVNAPAATAQISASDPDPGSTLTFGMPNLVTGRLAGQIEPPGWSVSSSGLMTFNTVGKTVGQLYNAMVTVTDNNGNQIFLDFIINIVGPSNPPVFDYSVTPANGQVFNLTVGQNLTFLVRATDSDPGSTVSFSVSGLNSFITTANFSSAPLPATGNPAQTTFSYTPVVAQSGTQTVLNFIATDNIGVQATSSVTINVIAQPAPVFIAPTPGQGTIRSILTGVNQADNIVASSSLGSNVSIAFATLPPGATTSPAVPTAGANPGSTTMNWIPIPSQFGQHTLSYTATISSTPTIFSVRSYDLIVNTLPVFASTPVTGATDCSPYLYNIVATDADIPFGDVVNIVSVLPLPSWLTLTSTGNGTATLSGNPTTANVGTYTITLRAEDFYYHNYADVEQSFIITVASCCTPPVITCPSDITVNNITGQCGANVSFTATATGTSPTITYSHASGSFFPVGTTTVTATATNSCGTAPCTFTVTVADNENPTISCPSPIAVNTDLGVCGAAVSYTVTSADNCSGQVVTQTGGLASGSVFPVGVTTNSFLVTDASGNTASCSFTVTVTDNEAPIITCAGPVTINNTTGLCTGTTTLTPPTVSDNCSSFGNALSFNGGYVDVPNSALLNPFNEWTLETWVKRTNTGVQESLIEKYNQPASTYGYLLRILATNKAMAGFDFGSFAGYFISGTTTILPNVWYHLATTVNRTTGEMKLYVNGVLDAQVTGMIGLPTIPNTASLKLGARGDDAATRLSNGGLMDEIRIWSVERSQAQIQASMNSEMSAQAGLVALYHFNQGIAGGNNSGVTTATDASGNSHTGNLISFALTGPTSNWVGGQGFAPTVTNNAPATYPVGTTTVTWTVTDIHGNSSTCTQAITVTDNEAPVISVSPVVSCYAANNFGCSINLGATATDNCGVLSLTSNAPGCFAVGTTVVTWTATDIHGNVSTATQLVTRNPEINIDICAGITRTIYTGTVNGAGPFGPQNINLTSTVSGGTPGYSYSWSPAAGLNNPFIANPVASPAVTTTYTLTVTDSKGCTRSLSITINVLPLSSAICSGSGNNVQFSVCHIPPGNPSNPQNICISVNALNAHLTSGSNGHNNCYLGPCGQQLCFSTVPGAPNFVQAKGTIEETVEIPVIVEASKDEPTDAFKVHVYPNPSASDFSLKVISKSSAPISVKITDLSGKVMTVNSTVVKGSIINLGNELRAGTYIAEVIQGENRQVIKLVKLN